MDQAKVISVLAPIAAITDVYSHGGQGGWADDDALVYLRLRDARRVKELLRELDEPREGAKPMEGLPLPEGGEHGSAGQEVG